MNRTNWVSRLAVRPTRRTLAVAAAISLATLTAAACSSSSASGAWATSHLSAWASVWAKATGLPGSVMLKAASDDASNAVPITAVVIGSEQQVSDAFTSAGLIPVHVNFNNYVDTSFNNTASVTS